MALIWIFSVVLLGLGGLLRERAVGSSSLTLTLPVSRRRLMAVRLAVGILQAITLAVIPWFLNFLISASRRTPFSFVQAGYCILLLTGGGTVCFAIAILSSSTVEGEYTAAAIAYGVMIFWFVMCENVQSLKGLNLISLVTGAEYIDKQTFLFSRTLPWPTILGSLSLAAVMVLASVIITQRRDF